MNKQLAALLLAAATVAVGGCGSSSSASSGSPAPASSPSASPSPFPTGSASPDPLRTHFSGFGAGKQLKTAPSPPPSERKLVSVPWQFLRLADDGKQVQISFMYGGCLSFDYAQLQQDADSVEITIWGTDHVNVDTACPAFIGILRGSVTLDAPLGSRELLHGPVSVNHGLPQR